MSWLWYFEIIYTLYQVDAFGKRPWYLNIKHWLLWCSYVYVYHLLAIHGIKCQWHEFIVVYIQLYNPAHLQNGVYRRCSLLYEVCLCNSQTNISKHSETVYDKKISSSLAQTVKISACQCQRYTATVWEFTYTSSIWHILLCTRLVDHCAYVYQNNKLRCVYEENMPLNTGSNFYFKNP